MLAILATAIVVVLVRTVRRTDDRVLLVGLVLVLGGALGDNVGSFNFKAITDRFSELMYAYPFRVPARFALIIRAVVSQEGLAMRLDPSFRIIRVDEDPASPTFGRLSGECFYFAVNKARNASRGGRPGIHDPGSESFLWFAMRDIVRDAQPHEVFWENVDGVQQGGDLLVVLLVLLPLVGALLKNEQDVTLFEKLVFMQSRNR